jgi:ribosomal 50S subunit-associated protein YjgA (DUF615 family)
MSRVPVVSGHGPWRVRPVKLMYRLFLACCLAITSASAQESPEPPMLPLLAEEGGPARLEALLAVPWAEVADGEARDLPMLTEHWTRVSRAFFAYSGAMAEGQPVLREWAAVAPAMLRLGGLLAQSGDAVVRALPEDDSTREQRAEGVTRIRSGLTRMSQGALLVLVEMPAEVRTTYVRDLAEALPAVLQAIPDAEVPALRAQVRGAGVLLTREEAALLDAAAGQTSTDVPEPPLQNGAPDRLLVAQTAAGWAGAMPIAWCEHLLTVEWSRHAADQEAAKADAFALIVGAHAWLTALGEERVHALDEVSPLVDAALRAGIGVVAKDLRVADKALFEARLSDLTVRAAAVASHHSAKDREPLAAVLERQVPALLRVLPEAQVEALRTSLRDVADKRLARALSL